MRTRWEPEAAFARAPDRRGARRHLAGQSLRTLDATTIVMASLLLTTAALTAALLPARRAARVRPTDALRFE